MPPFTTYIFLFGARERDGLTTLKEKLNILGSGIKNSEELSTSFGANSWNMPLNRR